MANGGGAITFRLIATALGMITLGLVTYEGERMNNHLDAITDKALSDSARIDVHAQRLDTLDAGQLRLWTAVHGNGVTLQDHEHRITVLEATEPRR
jgi:hypothetical protein